MFVNLADSELTSDPLPKQSMTMGKLHKKTSQLIVPFTEDLDKWDGQVIKGIALKNERNLAPFFKVIGNGRKKVLNFEALK